MIWSFIYLRNEEFFFERFNNIAKPSHQLKIEGQRVRTARAGFGLDAAAAWLSLASPF
jgi:hypothetical protein